MISLSYGDQTSLGSVMARTRTMIGSNVPSALNRIPQVSGLRFYYQGELQPSKWVAIIDVTLNSYNPCTVYDSDVPGTHPATLPDAVHSGLLSDVSSTKQITLPQIILLDPSQTYAVCYAEISGTVNDLSWRDSYIRLKITKLQSVSSHKVNK